MATQLYARIALSPSSYGLPITDTSLRHGHDIDAIDRRFYRKKYNGQQVLAQFAQTARDETDLDALLAELVRVVDETLQPEHVSVTLFDSASTQGRR